jgi:hypothetical protein
MPDDSVMSVKRNPGEASAPNSVAPKQPDKNFRRSIYSAPSLLRRNQSFADGEQHQFGGAVDIHFFHEVRAMHGNGVYA